MQRLAVVLLMVVLTGCWNPMQKYTEAQKKVEEAKKAAEQAQKAIATQVAQAQQPQQPAQGADIKRAPGNTPEITGAVPREVNGGQTADVVFTVDAVDPNDLKVDGDGMCHVKAYKLISPTQLQATVVVDDGERGGCQIRLVTKGRTAYYSMNVRLSPAAEARVQAKAQAEQEAAMKKMNDYIAHAKDVVGKKWDVKLPNGKSDTWTLANQSQMGFSEFKDSKGGSVQIMVGENDAVSVQVGGCVLLGKLAGGKLTEGQSPIPGCAIGTGAWSATVNR